jgi:hypothetical protein
MTAQVGSGMPFKDKNNQGNTMLNENIQELYQVGLEKFAGDTAAAKDFVLGFLKEAAGADAVAKSVGMLGSIGSGALKTLGTGAAAFGIGLGMHGISTLINNAGNNKLKEAFSSSLAHVVATNPIVQDADSARVNSYAETIFKFAPHVACDSNLLSSILANAVHGEGIDPMTIRTLTDLEAKLMESRKNSLFSPKSYM